MSNVFHSLLFYRKLVTMLLKIPGFQQFSKASLQKFPILFPSICKVVFLFPFFAVATGANLVAFSLHEQDHAEVVGQMNPPGNGQRAARKFEPSILSDLIFQLTDRCKANSAEFLLLWELRCPGTLQHCAHCL